MRSHIKRFSKLKKSDPTSKCPLKVWGTPMKGREEKGALAGHEKTIEQLFVRLESRGIMGGLIKAPLKPLNTIVL